jgi:peptide/nickel transport system substrate-binding protein
MYFTGSIDAVRSLKTRKGGIYDGIVSTRSIPISNVWRLYHGDKDSNNSTWGILILGAACGTAEAPDPTAAPAAEPTSAPEMSGTVQPTSTPQAAAPPAEAEVNPGTLNVMVGDLATERFDIAMVGGNVGGANYGRVVHGFLISMNEETEMVPGIAEDWELSDNGLTWTFTIREGAKFHDGSDVTPEDVLWTLQHSFGPEAHVHHPADSTAASISRLMDTIELSGPNQINVTTQSPFVAFAGNISEISDKWYGIMPARDELYNEDLSEAFDRNPIGAGIMKLVGHTRAQVMEFERFDEYYYQPANGFSEDKRVKFQNMDMFLVPEESTRVAALRSREADIVPASLATKGQIEAGGGRLIFGQEGVYAWVRFLGCYEPQHPCHDKRVRQAFDYAINKELIRDTLYGGPEVFQVKGWAVVTPNTIGYTPDIDPWPFDPDKARQLLADAGYPNGEGFGKLIVNTWPSTAMPFQVEAAQLAADIWRRELNIEVEVNVGDSTGIDSRADAGELNGQILWRENESRKDASILTNSGYGDPNNLTSRRHDDPELYSLAQETLRVLDLQEREIAYQELYRRLREESYDFGIGYVNIPWGVGPRVKEWKPAPFSLWPSQYHTIVLE